LEEWTRVGDKIEVLCSYGQVHPYTVVTKGKMHRGAERNVVVAMNEAGELVALRSDGWNHYSAGWRFKEGFFHPFDPTDPKGKAATKSRPF
jgi:guanyl-specific ribonuclease Sa